MHSMSFSNFPLLISCKFEHSVYVAGKTKNGKYFNIITTLWSHKLANQYNVEDNIIKVVKCKYKHQ